MKNNLIELRKIAVQKYLAGEKPIEIYKRLNKSKKWFFKWLSRYQDQGAKRARLETWYQDLPRVPKHQPHRTKTDMEMIIISIRDQLAKTRYAQIGAETILWELQKLGIKKSPSVRTIERIIKRNGRVLPKRKHNTYAGKNYPSPTACSPNDIHQFDIVGRRYIKSNQGLQSFYSFHLKDIYSHVAQIKQYQYKNAEAILDYFVNKVWRSLGTPYILQMDNFLAIRGSNRHPRSFSNLIKLCLLLEIEVLFIPPGEPWRSGIIESFNNAFDKKFFRTQQFRNLDHLADESDNFERFYNIKRPNSALNVKEHGSKIPMEVFKRFQQKTLSDRFNLNEFKINNKLKIPLTEGKISFIRWIKEDRLLHLFTERFLLKHPLANEYVKATIFTKEQILRVYFEDEVVSEFKYKLNTKSNHG